MLVTIVSTNSTRLIVPARGITGQETDNSEQRKHLLLVLHRIKARGYGVMVKVCHLFESGLWC